MASENVELVVRIRAEGQAALAALRQGMSGLSSESRSTAAGVSGLDAAELKLAGTLRLVTSASDEASAANRRNRDSMAESVVKGILLSEAFGQVASAVKSATVESALYASRTEQLNIIMDQLARTNGLNVASVRAQANAVRDLGITTQESRNTINQMIFAQLDLTKATDLARVAQNAAKVAGISSSEALNGIINGIKQQEVQILRTYGINVQLEQAMIRQAALWGKSKEQLTDNERANIALNEVLKKGQFILGAYEVSLTTSAGQLQSLTRLTEEAQNALGERFAPALQRVVSFLTSMATGVKENADEVANFVTVITSASLAAAAFKFTPGPLGVKAAAAAVVGGGSFILGETDAQEAAIEATKNALAKIESDRKRLIRDAQSGRISDKEVFLREDQRLKDLELQVEKNLTEALAREYKKRRENAGKGSLGLVIGDDSPLGISLRRGDKGGQLFGEIKETRTSDIDLGKGRVIRSSDLERAIVALDYEDSTFDPSGLKFQENKEDVRNAQFASFRSKLLEAQKSATAALERARASDLTGEDRVRAERSAAFGKVQEQFGNFDAALRGGREYQRLLGTISAEFEILLAKEKRLGQADVIRREKKVTDVQSQIAVDQLRQRTSQAQEIASVRAEGPGREEEEINRLRANRLELAQLEKKATDERNQADLDAALKIAGLEKNKKAELEAQAAFKIASLKSEAELSKQTSDAEHDAKVALLKLQKEQKKQQEEILEFTKKLGEAEQALQLSRLKDSGSRAIRLVQATTLPGNERFAQEAVLRIRESLANKEYELAIEQAGQQRQAAQEKFERTKNSVELERELAEIIKRESTANYTREKELLDARLDREVQIAEIRKRQNEELRQSLGQLYDAARTAGGVGVKEFLQGYVEQVKKTVFVNLGEELFRGATAKLGGIIPGQEKIDPATGKGTGELTLIGRILRGTPLGIDPAKLALDRQINAQDRNTKSIDRLSDILSGGSISGSLPAGSLPPVLSGALGTILGGAGGINPSVIIRNFAGESANVAAGERELPIDRPGALPGSIGGGLGGFLNRVTDFVKPKFDPITGKAKFSAGTTALAAAAAIPGILAGIEEGGVKGGLGIASSALGAAASIPGPQQPFLIAGSILAGLFGGFLKSKKQKKEEELARRLENRFELPDSIDLTRTLAGDSVDYNYRGELRSFQQQANGGPVVNVNINTIDAKSFFERGPEISDSVMNMLQLGHPLRGQIGEIAGVTA